jgi:hypothetical protein
MFTWLKPRVLLYSSIYHLRICTLGHKLDDNWKWLYARESKENKAFYVNLVDFRLVFLFVQLKSPEQTKLTFKLDNSNFNIPKSHELQQFQGEKCSKSNCPKIIRLRENFIVCLKITFVFLHWVFSTFKNVNIIASFTVKSTFLKTKTCDEKSGNIWLLIFLLLF